VETVRSKYAVLSGALNERSRRLWAASEAMSLGHGGIAVVERATGISRSTITRGIREVESGGSDALPPHRMRVRGVAVAGRPTRIRRYLPTWMPWSSR